MNKIAIVGAGGFGREVKWLIECINKQKHIWDFAGFYDDDLTERKNIESNFLLGNIDALNKVEEPLAIAIAIGNPLTKEFLYQRINNKNIYFPTLIHPSVHIGNNIQIGKGCIICANTILTCDIDIQDFIILNLSCTVGHDAVIQSFCSIMPSVNISGEVIVGKNCFIGTGVQVINQLSIGANTIIGAGALVHKNIPENVTAVGVPAKIK